MTIRINNIVIHELIKEQGITITEKKCNDEVLDKNDETTNKMASKIIELYSTKGNTASQGVFNESDNRFKKAFIDFYNLDIQKDEDFINLTIVSMEELQKFSRERSGASGGYILYIDYTANKRYLLIAMVKNKDAIQLDYNLKPTKILQLDLDKLYQVARIDFEKYGQYVEAPEAEISYLSFIKRKNYEEVAGYFINAHGCVLQFSPQSATKKLIQQSGKFFRDNDLLRERRFEFKEDIINYLHKRIENNENSKLSEIAEIARKYILYSNQEEADEITNEFLQYLNDECSIPDEFQVDEKTCDKLSKVKLKTDYFTLEFDCMVLNNDSRKIHYDRDNYTITFKLSEEERAKLDEDLKDY